MRPHQRERVYGCMGSCVFTGGFAVASASCHRPCIAILVALSKNKKELLNISIGHRSAVEGKIDNVQRKKDAHLELSRTVINSCTHIYAHTHKDVRNHTHTHMHTRTHYHTHTQTHKNIYTNTYINTHTRTHMQLDTYTHMHSRTLTHTHTHIYTYTYTHANLCTYSYRTKMSICIFASIHINII